MPSGKPAIQLPTGPPSSAMIVRLRLGVFVGDRIVGHTGLTAHWVPLWYGVPHQLVTYCGVAFRRDHAELLDGPRGQPCEPCLIRMAQGRLPDPALLLWATWRPPRPRPALGGPYVPLEGGSEEGGLRGS